MYCITPTRLIKKGWKSVVVLLENLIPFCGGLIQGFLWRHLTKIGSLEIVAHDTVEGIALRVLVRGDNTRLVYNLSSYKHRPFLIGWTCKSCVVGGNIVGGLIPASQDIVTGHEFNEFPGFILVFGER